MTRFRDPEILLKIFLPILLVIGAGIAPRPHWYAQQLQQAASAISDGSQSAAAVKIVKAAGLYPDRQDFWMAAAKNAQAGGDLKLAIDALNHLASLRQLTTEEKLALGDAYRDSRDTQTAIQAWESALPDEGAYSRLVETYLVQKDYPSAVRALQGLLAHYPDRPAEAYQVGLLLAALDPESALPYLEQAAILDPSLSQPAGDLRDSIRTARLFDEPAYTYVSAGQALARLGQWELAAEAFHKAIELRPDYAEAWAYLGEARQHAPGAPVLDPEALEDLQTAIALDPQSLSANLFTASYYRRSQDYETALKYLYTASEIDPENSLVLVEIAGTLSDAGDLPSAQGAYQKLVEMNLDDPYYWRLLAQFCLSNQVQVRETGLPAARQAVLLAPNDAVSLDVLGSAFLQLGDSLNAERTLQRALGANPLYAPAHLHLGMNYILQGDYQQAQSELRLAISLAPGSAAAQTAERILSKYYP